MSQKTKTATTTRTTMSMDEFERRHLDPLPIQEEESPDDIIILDDPVMPATEKERWPQSSTLMRDYEDIIFHLLRTVDECEVVYEVNASDAGNVKGNKWVKLQDVVFGGREDGTRGLITSFPAIVLPSKLKKKVMQIWQFGCKADKVSPEMHVICQRQLKEYEDNKKKVSDENKASKEQYAAMVEEMRAYETEKGALPPGATATLPPGAKPPDGGGRINHSTNLQIRQPAGFGYANITTADSASVNTAPPDPRSEQRSVTRTPTPSATVNNKALKELEGLGSTFKTMMERLIEHPATPSRSTPSEITIASKEKEKQMNKKKRKIISKLDGKQRKKKELMEQISFLEVRKDDDLDWYKELTTSYRTVCKEVTDLLDDLDKDDEDLVDIERNIVN